MWLETEGFEDLVPLREGDSGGVLNGEDLNTCLTVRSLSGLENELANDDTH
jgi:hypothetical protein